MKLLLDILRSLFGMKPAECGVLPPVREVEDEVVNNPAQFEYFTTMEYIGPHFTQEMPDTFRQNMLELLGCIDVLRREYGKPMVVTSGWRPPAYNEEIGGAKNSAHITCQAIDIKDLDGSLKAWLKENTAWLVTLDLYMEKGKYTPTWVHLQTRPTKSGRRVFIP